MPTHRKASKIQGSPIISEFTIFLPSKSPKENQQKKENKAHQNPSFRCSQRKESKFKAFSSSFQNSPKPQQKKTLNPKVILSQLKNLPKETC